MKTPFFIGVALLGLACGRPAAAQVLPGTTPTSPSATPGVPGSPGTITPGTITPGTITPGQPGSLTTAPGVLPGDASPTGTPLAPAAGSVVDGQLAPRTATPRSSRGASRSQRTTTTPATNPLRP